MKLEFTGKVSASGELKIINRPDFNEALKQFAGKDIVGFIEKKISKRTSPQNRYYFGVVIPVLQQAFKDLGHRLSKEEVNTFLKMRFLKIEIANPDTAEFIIEGHRKTSSLTKSEFADYVSEIQQFAAETLNTVIPDPLEQTKLNYEKN